jgi:FixJ family two-component response regulator
MASKPWHLINHRPRELIVRSETTETGSALVALRDSGTGLDPATIDRLFDPFFTTKTGGWAWALRSPLPSSRPMAGAFRRYPARPAAPCFSSPALHDRWRVVTETPATVAVVDDDPAIREALESLLRSVGLRVQLFGSVPEFLGSGRPDGPSCLVLDVRLPGRSGLDLQDELLRSETRLPVIFITGHGDIPMSVRAMKAGAVEFLTKPFRDQELLDAVQVALERDRGRREAAKALACLQSRYQSLTARERAVMALVVTGRPNKMIAAEIGISEITVKAHRGRVMRRMGARSLADLVRIADSLNNAHKG